MHAPAIFLAAALFAVPVAPALAQSAAGQPDGAPAAAAPSAAPTAAGAIVPATPADLKPAANVYDPAGGQVGTIESVTSTGAVVFTGVARAQIPLASFSKNAQGLVIGITKTQLESAVAKAAPPKP